MSEQAVKIFEALSNVDEELLERCNQKVNRKTGTVYRIYQRYGRAMAACVCLIVVGAAAWGGYSLITGGSNGANTSGANGAPMELYQMAQTMDAVDGGAYNENCEAGLEDQVVENEIETTTGIQTEADPAPAAGATASLETAKQQTQDMQSQRPADITSDVTSSDTGSNVTENQAGKYAELRELENALTDSRKEIPWGEACTAEPFSSYLPTALPAGYEAFSARRSAFPEKWDNIIYKWTDGEHILYLNMTPGEVMTREEIERRDGLNEYLAEDFRKELIMDMPAGDPVSFTLYYADGMRIDFSGYVTVDEMWEVVESIKM